MADCGVREFCITCPAVCQTRNNRLPSSAMADACLEADYGDQRCTPGCNNLACGYDHGDCSPEQIAAVCWGVQANGDFILPPTTTATRLDSLGLGSLPGTTCAESDTQCHRRRLVPAALQMEIAPINLLIHPDYNVMNSHMQLEYTIQWEDDRLWDHPCFGALPSLLSLGAEAGRSDQARYARQQIVDRFFTLKLDAADTTPGFNIFDETAEVAIETSTDWVEGFGPPNARAQCVNCVSHTATVEIELVQKRFDFFYYPFDVQRLKARFVVAHAHLFTCTNLSALLPMMPLDETRAAEDKLLPFTRQWLLVGSPDQSISMGHPLNANGEPQYDTCDLQLIIARSYSVFLYKGLFITMLCVLTSLATAAYLHPQEQIGERFTVLFLAPVILVFNFSIDLGLGTVTQLVRASLCAWVPVYLCHAVGRLALAGTARPPNPMWQLWVDVFNLIQLALVLISVVESIVVHYLFKNQQDRLAMSIDRVLRITLPWVLYPVLTGATFIFGLEQRNLCPESSLCGVGANEAEFRDREAITGRASGRNAALSIGLCGVVGTIVLSILLTWVRVSLVAREQHLSVAAMVSLLNGEEVRETWSSVLSRLNRNLTDEERSDRLARRWATATERVFTVFDLDDSGSIDFKELRQMCILARITLWLLKTPNASNGRPTVDSRSCVCEGCSTRTRMRMRRSFARQ